MFETTDTLNITKAQDLFKKMVCACGPKCFKKLFSEAIDVHTLDEFYPVVMHAELTAALAMSAREQEKTANFDFADYLEDYFNIRPRQLMNVSVNTLAHIMEATAQDVETLLSGFGFTIEQGRVTRHKDLSHRRSRLAPLREKIRKA